MRNQLAYKTGGPNDGEASTGPGYSLAVYTFVAEAGSANWSDVGVYHMVPKCPSASARAMVST